MFSRKAFSGILLTITGPHRKIEMYAAENRGYISAEGRNRKPMKLLTILIPCYNSAAYMSRAIESVLPGGNELDVMIIDDGSSDDTGAIADRYAAQYPDIVRVVHQPNGGHGSGLNQGIRNGLGLYFKVLDSDDRIDPAYLPGLLDILRAHSAPERQLDLIIHDYVYDRENQPAAMSINYRTCLKPNRELTWDKAGFFTVANQFMIHCMVYRTQLLRDMDLVLPEHTFYEDNLYIYQPLPHVKKLWYYPKKLHAYFVGRADQSINQANLLKRLDQATEIAGRMITSYSMAQLKALPKPLRRYMINNCCGQLSTTCSLQCMDGERGAAMYDALWKRIRDFDPALYRALRRNLLGRCTCLPGKAGKRLLVWGYQISQNILFNK